MKAKRIFDRMIAVLLAAFVSMSCVPFLAVAEELDAPMITDEAAQKNEDQPTDDEISDEPAGGVTEDKVEDVTYKVQSSGDGKISINSRNDSKTEYSGAPGSTFTVYARPNSDHTIIESFEIDGEPIELTEQKNGFYTCEYTIPDTHEDEGTISIVFTTVYNVTVTYDPEKGTVYKSDDPNETVQGEISISCEEELVLNAKPYEGCYVKSVVIDDEELALDSSDTSDDGMVTISDISKDTDHSISITFAVKTYELNVSETSNGLIELSETTVDHDKDAKVSVTPDDGHYISQIWVNGLAVSPDERVEYEGYTIGNYSSGAFSISKIREDIEISAEFEPITDITFEDISITGEGIISQTGNDYFIKGNSSLVFSYPSDECTVNILNTAGGLLSAGTGDGTAAISSGTQIGYIEVIFDESEYEKNVVHTVDLTNDPITVTLNGSHSITLAAEPYVDGNNAFGKNNISVTWDIELPDQLSVKELKYWIIGDDPEIGSVTISDRDELAKHKFTVDCSSHDPALVTLMVRITDTADQPSEASTNFIVNTNAPVITSVEVTGERLPEAVEGYYSSERQAIISISDSPYTFNKDPSAFTIKYGGNELSAEDVEKMVTWESDEENGILKAIVTFSLSGTYEWSMDYVNSAGISAAKLPGEGQSQNDYKYSFTILLIDNNDRSELVCKDKNWSEILSTLTFGLFGDSSITVYAVPSQGFNVQSIMFYKDVITSEEDAKMLTYKELDEKYESKDETYFVESADNSIKVDVNETVVVYARLLNKAGEHIYLSTCGIITEDKAPSPVSLVMLDKPEKGNFFNSNVSFALKVSDDKDDNGFYSGLSLIYYEVLFRNSKKDDTVLLGRGDLLNTSVYGSVDASGAYYKNGKWTTDRIETFPGERETTDTQDQYQDHYIFTVEDLGTTTRSDNMFIRVHVKDNAGNETVVESETFSINKLKMGGILEFSDDKSVNNDHYTSRQATITISMDDRKNVEFDGDAAAKALRIGYKPSIEGDHEFAEDPDYITISPWEEQIADGKKTYTAQIDFNKEGFYKVDTAYSYTNNFGNGVGDGTLTTNDQILEFVVDHTAPTGTISIDSNTWQDLGNVLFRWFTNEQDRYKVSIACDDNISKSESNACDISCFITSDPAQLGSDDLDRLSEDKWARYSGEITLSDPKEYVVYARITDRAGNYCYICSDGHIIDIVPPVIVPSPDKPIAVRSLGDGQNIGIYNSDVTVRFDVIDNENDAVSAGLARIEYKIESDGVETDPEIIVLAEDGNDSFDDIIRTHTVNVLVKAEEHNSSNVRVTLTAADRAGNTSTEYVDLDIDITPPSISVVYDNNSDNNGNGYFNKPRTAEISIKERSSHFNSRKATDGITITAVDAQGNEVSGHTVGEWEDRSPEGALPDEQIHVMTISYQSDANYTFKIEYTDEADNKNTAVNYNGSVAPERFTVDTSAPIGTVRSASYEGRSEEWSRLLSSIDFGFWSNSGFSISGEGTDKTSPIAELSYHMSSSVDALTERELASVTDWRNTVNGGALSSTSSFSNVEILPNTQTVVYLKIADMAGNTSYISTNGMIADNIEPREELFAPEITLTPQQAASGIYNSDVTVRILVDDPLVGGTYSGLRSISYRVLNMGNETQSDNVYEFSNSSPSQSELLKTWEGEVVISSDLNNSNDVILEVTAYDNAGNTSMEYISLQIDKTAPTVDISFDDNKASDASDGYYRGRTAVIVITERNFDPGDVELYVTRNGVSSRAGLEWASTSGSGNGDDATHIASLPINGDGVYSMSISVTDMAGNSGTERSVSTFTVDASAPSISVSFDNNDVYNDSYFQKQRTATITVRDTNFNANSAKVSITGMLDGQPVKAPEVTKWEGGNGTYTAKAGFSADGDYTFSVTASDLAGNRNSAVSYSNSASAGSFTIDTADPSLKLEVNGSAKSGAYSGEVVPVVSYSDINYSPNDVEIMLSGSNTEVTDVKATGNTISFKIKAKSGETVTWNGRFEDQYSDGGTFIGRILTMEDFPRSENGKDLDDIYTMSTSVTDKAGRTTAKSLSFSVNRYGSTYDLSAVQSILGKYITKPQNVKFSEINPNSLAEIKITVFKNNAAIVLKENEDYKITSTGGNGEWYRYTYDINSSVFKDNGVYRITVHSKDAADNIAENTLDTKNSDISFGVDDTLPTIVVVDLENGETYAQEKKTVTFTADDNLKLDHIEVYLDGSDQVYKSWNSAEVERILSENSEFTFELTDESNRSHAAKIVCTDAAGNMNDVEITGFYVTRDLLVRYYNNKLLFFGSIGGTLLAAGGAIFLIIKKKRENN
ncbi:MAG: Ig-like domain repeat protein [Ruminococcus sp.]|nr:Ig-like domain repeat protein [Ruminococcus sp.]